MNTTNPVTSLERNFASAVSHYQEGRPQKAQRKLLKIQRRSPDIPEVLHLLSLVALQINQPDQAVVYLEKAVAAVSDSADLYNLLSTALSRSGKTVEAAAAGEKSAALAPGNAEVHFNLGNKYYALKRWSEAALSFEKATDLAPEFFDAYGNWIDALKDGGLLAEAAVSQQEKTHNDSKAPEPHCRLGMILFEEENLPEAESHYRQAIDLSPGFAWGHYLLAILLRKDGRLGEALASFRTLVRQNPSVAEAALRANKTLVPLADYLSADLRPDALDKIRVFPNADISKHSARYFEVEGIRAVPLGGKVGGGEGCSLFVAELDRGGVLGGPKLPITRSGDVFVKQLTHNPFRLHTSPAYQKWEAVLLANKTQIAAAVLEEREYPGAHVLLGSHTNFGHWLFNNFSRLLLAKTVPGLEKLSVVVGNDLAGTRLECLTLAGYDESRIVQVSPGEIAWFEKPWVPSFPYFVGDGQEKAPMMWAPEVVHFIRDTLGIPSGGPGGRRLFITRQNAAWRRLKNESAVTRALEPFGFEVVDPGAYSLEDQIHMAAEAEIIMGPFGAGMGLHIFAPRGSHVVEMKLRQVEMDIHPTVAGVLGQSHHNIYCERAMVDKYRLNDDFIAPVDEVVSLVKEIT